MKASRAAELYKKLTGIGPHKPKDPAILLWEGPTEVRLRVFPVVPGRTSTVEYTLTAPTRYRDGRYHLDYPPAEHSDHLVSPVLRIFPQSPAARITLEGRLAAAAQPVAAADDDPVLDSVMAQFEMLQRDLARRRAGVS